MTSLCGQNSSTQSCILLMWLSTSSIGSISHTDNMAACNSWIVVGRCGRAHSAFLSSCQTGSMGLRSGEDGGWKSNRMLDFLNHFIVDLLLWLGALSCWNFSWGFSDFISTKKPSKPHPVPAPSMLSSSHLPSLPDIPPQSMYLSAPS